MGFLTNRYSKPGPGVAKDAPEKRRIIVCFEILGRKFWKLQQVNLIFLMLCLPIVAVMIGLNLLVINVFHLNNALLSNLITFFPLSLLSLPITGMTYVTRNFAREEHAFVWYDFFDKIKKNWKQSLLHGILTYLIIFAAYCAILFYFSASATRGWVFLIPGAICAVLLALFVFSQYYIFQMIVTFELSYKNILKNGLIFSLAAFLRNLLLSVLHVVVWFFVILALSVPEALPLGILFLLIGIPVFTSYFTNFVTYPVIVRYMIKPYYGKDEAEDSTKESDHYHSIENENDGEKKEEYVFENGRLVKKMDDVESVFEDHK